MKKNKRVYSPFQVGSAIFMMLTLAWLIVSIPFVYASQEELAKQNNTSCTSPIDCSEEEGNPLTNTEEKASNGPTTFSEEYLHEHYLSHFFSSTSSPDYACKNSGIYIAFHGELIVPPPDAA